jgi:hypothetical protein
MNKGDAIIVNPFGCDNIHVGIIDKITNKLVQCKEWYGIGTPNLVMGSAFSRDIVKKVDNSIFYEAKKLWNNINL